MDEWIAIILNGVKALTYKQTMNNIIRNDGSVMVDKVNEYVTQYAQQR